MEHREEVCPKCRRILVPLATYEPTPLETMPGIEADASDTVLLLLGVSSIRHVWQALTDLLLNLWGYFIWRWKCRRVHRLKKRWLPSFPQTLICANCLTVLPRR